MFCSHQPVAQTGKGSVMRRWMLLPLSLFLIPALAAAEPAEPEKPTIHPAVDGSVLFMQFDGRMNFWDVDLHARENKVVAHTDAPVSWDYTNVDQAGTRVALVGWNPDWYYSVVRTKRQVRVQSPHLVEPLVIMLPPLNPDRHRRCRSEDRVAQVIRTDGRHNIELSIYVECTRRGQVQRE